MKFRLRFDFGQWKNKNGNICFAKGVKSNRYFALKILLHLKNSIIALNFIYSILKWVSDWLHEKCILKYCFVKRHCTMRMHSISDHSYMLELNTPSEEKLTESQKSSSALDLSNKGLKKVPKPDDAQNVKELILDDNALQKIDNIDSFLAIEKVRIYIKYVRCKTNLLI